METPWRGGFETQREEQTATLSVTGTLPAWLSGTYLLNGPGQFEVGGDRLDHWFDPLAMIRRVSFSDGGVEYANRFVRSRDYTFAREHGRVRTAFPGTAADRPLWRRLWQALAGEFPDNPVIGVVRIGGRTLAVTESPTGLEIDPETLSVVGRYDLTAGLDVDLTLAHQHYDPEADAFFNLGVTYGRTPAYTLFRRPNEWRDGPARPEPLTRVRIDRGYVPYVHSFAITDRYAVVSLPPVGVSLGKLLRGSVTGGTFLDAFEGYDEQAQFVVLDRATGDHVGTVPADPFFVYHHANAFETNGAVVVDCIAYPDERAITGLTFPELLESEATAPPGDLVRFRVPLSGGSVERTTLREGPMEFPMIEYGRDNGHEYDHLWVCEGGDGPLPERIARLELDGGSARSYEPDTGAAQSYDPGSGVYPGEATFVPAPDPEKTGVLLSFVTGTDRSAVIVLDAETLDERARAPLPHRLPYAFHGQFYADWTPGRTML